MNNIYFLKDSKINDWLIEGFSSRGIKVNFIGMKNYNVTNYSRIRRIVFLHTLFIINTLKALTRSKKNDIIICFLDVIGLYVFLLSKLLFLKRNIVVINVMFNEGEGLISELKKKLFWKMLKDRKVCPCVTSLNLSGNYKKIFNLPQKEFFLLHDCYGNQDIYKREYLHGENYVFCGGKNARDWETIVKVASMLPEVKFVIVGARKDTLGEKYSSNIEYYFNISYNEFQQLMLKSSIIALPLNTEAPAGLIVLFSAGLMSKPVITTDNVTINEYITSGLNGILVKKGDYKKFATEIKQLMQQPDKQKEFGMNLQKRVVEIGSPDVYIGDLINILNKIKTSKITI